MVAGGLALAAAKTAAINHRRNDGNARIAASPNVAALLVDIDWDAEGDSREASSTGRVDT